MYEDLVTTKMDLFIDEEYWVEKGKEDINLASSKLRDMSRQFQSNYPK